MNWLTPPCRQAQKIERTKFEWLRYPNIQRSTTSRHEWTLNSAFSGSCLTFACLCVCVYLSVDHVRRSVYRGVYVYMCVCVCVCAGCLCVCQPLANRGVSWANDYENPAYMPRLTHPPNTALPNKIRIPARTFSSCPPRQMKWYPCYNKLQSPLIISSPLYWKIGDF